MKLFLAIDDYIYLYNGKYYIRKREMIFDRYLRVFDDLRLVARCEEVSTVDSKWVLINNPHIEIAPVPMFRNPRQYLGCYYAVGKVLRNALKECNAAVLRLPATISTRVGKLVMKQGIPYATEIVYDANDGVNTSESIFRKLLWTKIDKEMRNICYHANGVSCVTEFHLQKRYFTKKTDGFCSHYSSITLDKSFYGGIKTWKEKSIYTISHIANQIQFNGRKGHNLIIEMVALLKKRGIHTQVQFVGMDYQNGISQLKDYSVRLGVAEYVNFLGEIEHNMLNTYLSQTDLFVMPTKAEGLPRVVIEAMSQGLPCITTNVSGNSELIDKDFLVDDFYDVESLTEKVEHILTIADLYNQQSKENFERSLKYEKSVLQARRDDFYSKLIVCVK